RRNWQEPGGPRVAYCEWLHPEGLCSCSAPLRRGGTKVVCAVGPGPDDLRARIEYPTTSPHETISHAIAFLKKQAILEAITAVGIASFGPVDLALASPHYGYITFTPKAGWQNVDLVGQIQRSLNLPMAFVTDVNAA